MNVIQEFIYLDEYNPQYFVALPPLVSMSAIFHPNDLPTKSQIVVAVYEYAGRNYSTKKHVYKFIGVEIR